MMVAETGTAAAESPVQCRRPWKRRLIALPGPDSGPGAQCIDLDPDLPIAVPFQPPPSALDSLTPDRRVHLTILSAARVLWGAGFWLDRRLEQLHVVLILDGTVGMWQYVQFLVSHDGDSELSGTDSDSSSSCSSSGSTPSVGEQDSDGPGGPAALAPLTRAAKCRAHQLVGSPCVS